jgi:hypothetical protein
MEVCEIKGLVMMNPLWPRRFHHSSRIPLSGIKFWEIICNVDQTLSRKVCPSVLIKDGWMYAYCGGDFATGHMLR